MRRVSGDIGRRRNTLRARRSVRVARCAARGNHRRTHAHVRRPAESTCAPFSYPMAAAATVRRGAAQRATETTRSGAARSITGRCHVSTADRLPWRRRHRRTTRLRGAEARACRRTRMCVDGAALRAWIAPRSRYCSASRNAGGAAARHAGALRYGWTLQAAACARRPRCSRGAKTAAAAQLFAPDAPRRRAAAWPGVRGARAWRPERPGRRRDQF